MQSVLILNTDISVTSVNEVTEKLSNNNSLTVAVCNANTLVRCYRNERLRKIINSFDIKCPDGFPVAKGSSILYKNQQRRVDGFNIFIETIEKGLGSNLSHYFFGNEEDVTKKMIKNLEKNYPKINVVGYQCPPVGKVDTLLKDEYVENINKMNPDIIWISLGFPKQEEFIYEFKNNFPTMSNLVGIGAVFEWVAGTKIKAPEILANLGLEWIFRLAQEPKRLFRRYFVDNVLFIIYFVKQFIKR